MIGRNWYLFRSPDWLEFESRDARPDVARVRVCRGVVAWWMEPNIYKDIKL
jgi:hypothetical protein